MNTYLYTFEENGVFISVYQSVTNSRMAVLSSDNGREWEMPMSEAILAYPPPHTCEECSDPCDVVEPAIVEGKRVNMCERCFYAS